MIVYFKKLHEEAVVPSYKHEGDSGMDLHAVGEAGWPETGFVLQPGCRVLVPIGLSMQLSLGYEGQIRSRSGLAMTHGVIVLNTPGTIDNGYRGELKVILANLGNWPFTVQRGSRIAQLVIAPVTTAQIREVSALNTTDRGTGGFGSTGVKC